MKWEEVTLGDISTNIQTGPFGSQLHQSDYSMDGVPVVMPKDLIGGKVIEDSIAKVEEYHINRLSRHKLKEGNIIYARRGDVGKCSYITQIEEGWLCGTGCLKVELDEKKVVPKFVFYQLQKSETIGWIEKHAIGATMLNLNTSILSSVPISVPTLEIQQRIASILSAYDDLIENNQKQIKLLEEAAQRLYKEWFVDLRFPGYEEVEIVDGLPKGWSIKRLDEVYSIKYGKNLSTNDINDYGKYPVYGANGVIGYYDKCNCEQQVVLITSRGNGSGDVLKTCHRKSFVTNNSFVVNPMTEYKHCEMAFTYQLLKTVDFRAIRTGSAQPQLTNQVISTVVVNLPSRELIIDYCNKVTVMEDTILKLKKEIMLLEEVRDRLLPKLMSGEVEV